MRIVVVEDDKIQLKRLELVFGPEKGIELVGAFDNAEGALKKLASLAPDILLTDIEMAGMGGISFIRKAKELLPSVEILAFTVHDDIKTVLEAIKAGAVGYLLKTATAADLVGAVVNLHGGGVPLAPQVARAVFAELSGGKAGNGALSKRELDILKNVELGMKYQQIAEKLFISRHTVHTHVKNICGKLQAKGKTEAISKARAKHLI